MGPWGNLRGLHGALVSGASQLHGTLGGSVGLHGTPSGFDAGVPHSFEELCESLRPEMPERFSVRFHPASTWGQSAAAGFAERRGSDSPKEEKLL